MLDGTTTFLIENHGDNMKAVKQIIPMVVAGIIGGLFTLGGLSILADQPEVGNDQSTYTKQASFDNGFVPATFDFKAAAASAQQSVVTIKAAESNEVAQRRMQNQLRNDPFAQFFFGFGGRSAQPQPQKGSGSGVIISNDGYIVTNNHVIDFADDIQVELTDGRKYKASIVGTDPTTDLAVLKIDDKNLPAIQFGDSDKAKVGEWVLAVGNPFNYLTSTVTAGIISAKGRELNQDRNKKTIEDFIQTDAVVNPGNSGGALVDVNGKLIGINTMIYTRTGSYIGYSFAIPVNMMKEVTKDIIENGKGRPQPQVNTQKPRQQYYSYPPAQPNQGYDSREPRGPRLGITIEEIDEELAAELGLSFDKGLVVGNVVSGGSASFAGLQASDIIVKVNDTRIKGGADIIDLLDRSEVGDVLQVKVYRDGRFKTIPVKLRS